MECNSSTSKTTEMASNSESTISMPLDTLSELYNACDIGLMEIPFNIYLKESTDYVYQGLEISTQKVPLKKVNRDEQPRTLVCHDMKGGYLEDRFFWGSTSYDSYVFYHWNVIDVFVYFSHHFVTIPPHGWIDAAHHHGVKVLGTVITEGNNDTWNIILESQESTRKFADALVTIAKYYQFEGWLLNVENKINSEDINNLIYFVQYLTESIHREIQNSEIIWYDSVTNSGELNWQNELNDKNKEFFLNCDGIFLNYNWTESRLSNSHKFASELGRDVKDIYVGLDVWGRGCPGGGGLNSSYAMNLIRKQGLSVAIFAPGWTHEYFGPSTFQMLEDLFWAQLFPYLYIHIPIYEDMPFKTSFCRGAGRCYYYNDQENYDLHKINGENAGINKAFYNLRIQQPQLSVPMPHLEFTRSTQRILNDNKDEIKSNINDNEENKDKESKKLRIEHIYENSRSIVRICDNAINFETKLAPDVNSFEFCDLFSYKGGGCLKLITRDHGLYHRLFLIHFSSQQNIKASIVYSHFLDDSEWNEKDPILILGNDNNLKSILPYNSVRLNYRWRKCTYLTNFKTIDEIGVSFSRECDCYLGEIVLERREYHFGK